MNSENNVYTPEISTLIRLGAKKKDTEVSEKSLLVQEMGKSFHLIRDEYLSWRSILEVPYREYLSIK